jgi:cohesin complex subunit SCC1
LGLDFGDGDNLSAVEVGRDAGAAPRLSDVLGGKLDADGDLDMMSNRSRDPSEHPFGADMDFGGDFDAMNVDLGLDFGDNREKTPGQTRSPSRACESFITECCCVLF